MVKKVGSDQLPRMTVIGKQNQICSHPLSENASLYRDPPPHEILERSELLGSRFEILIVFHRFLILVAVDRTYHGVYETTLPFSEVLILPTTSTHIEQQQLAATAT